MNIHLFQRVLVNLWSAHMNPDVWEKPEEFRPERFLNDAGEIINRDRMIAFSLGMFVSFRLLFTFFQDETTF